MKIFLILLLSGCAVVTTEDKYPEGRTSKTTAYEIGRTEMITNFSDTQTKDGRSIAVGSASADVNVEAIKASGEALGKLVGNAVKSAAGLP